MTPARTGRSAGTGTDSKRYAPTGVLGGTFDPVHNGHLRTAVEVAAALGLAEVRLIPAGTPPHRAPPVGSADLRWRLLVAAVAGKSGLVPDNRELRRAGPSYTVDTLMELRTELGDRPVCLILGSDAFAGLDRWHRWQELSALAHIVVVHRPGHAGDFAGPVGELLAARRAPDPAALARRPAGAIWLQPVTPLAIAASEIRAQLRAGGDPAFLVPESVRELLLASGAYADPRSDSGADSRSGGLAQPAGAGTTR